MEPVDGEPFEFDVDGLRLAGERWAGDDRPPVVLLHGGGQTRHSWGATARRLAAGGRTVVALDARGHGDSAWHPGADYRIEAFEADLVAYLSALGRPAVLVGASMGGMAALVVAADRPDLVAALVLVDIVVRNEAVGVGRILDFMSAHPDGFATLEDVAEAVASYTPQRSRPRSLDGLRKNVRRGADGRWRWHWDPAFMEFGDDAGRAASVERLESAAARVRAPTLVVRGARSDVVSDEGLADIRRRMPDARVVDVAAAGHMVAGDDNDVFGAALDAFLAEIG